MSPVWESQIDQLRLALAAAIGHIGLSAIDLPGPAAAQ
jgi:hypothetical protein